MALQAVLLAYLAFLPILCPYRSARPVSAFSIHVASAQSPASPFSLTILTDLTAGMTRAEHLDCSGQWYKLVDIDRIASGMHIGDAV